MVKANFDNEKGKSKNGSGANLPSATKHGLVVVFLFALTIIIALAFVNLAGVVGESIKYSLKILLGWGAYGVPLLLLGVAYSLLPGERAWHWLHGLGLFLMVIGITGLFHSIIPITDRLVSAHQGSGGGYLGWASLTPLVKLLGFWGAVVFLLALVLAGILLLFETSLQSLYEHLRKFAQGFRGRAKLPQVNFPEIPKTQSSSAVEETSLTSLKKVFQSRTLASKEPVQPPLLEIKSTKSHVPKLSLDLLEDRVGKPTSGDIGSNMEKIRKTLQNFGIEVEMGTVNVGPTVTQYTLAPTEGVKLSQITALANDLALALAAHPIRIEAPIPGKSLVGIEVPNQAVATVGLKEILQSEIFKKRPSNLTVAIGKDVAGAAFVADIDRMPHLLIAGATGSGKSVCINSIIVSLLYTNSPDDLKFIIIDPKRVELASYNDIPHLLTPVVTDVNKTINALKWVVVEMDRRYQVLSANGKRNLQSYNQEAEERMPYLLVVIDELADLMAVAAVDVETAIIRLAQMARAVGIHLIVATQRPSVDVITGLIKANITSRIAFAVASGTDSRTILDTSGAEKLLGRGDCLFVSAELSKPKRLQAAFIGDAEIERVTTVLKEADQPDYNPEVVSKTQFSNSTSLGGGGGDDELLSEAKLVIVRAGKASASLLQRRLRVGYARAARLLDLLEERGVVGPPDGSKPRDVLVSQNDIEQDFATMPEETGDEATVEEEIIESDNNDEASEDNKIQ